MLRLDRRGGVDPAVVAFIVIIIALAGLVVYTWWYREKQAIYPRGDGGRCIVVDSRKYPGQKIWREGDIIVTETVWCAGIKENVAQIWFYLEPPLEKKIVVQFKVEGEAVKGHVQVTLRSFSDYKPVQWYRLDAELKDIKKCVWYTVELRKDGGSVEPEIPVTSIWAPHPHYLDRRPDGLDVSVLYPDKPIRIYVRILYRD